MSEASQRRENATRAAGNMPDLGSIPSEPSSHASAFASAELSEGHVIAGKYKIERVIGTGGMGVVHAARHIALDEPVAIKVLRPAMMDVPGMVTRFMREARAASKIKSDHVARVTDVDTLPSGVPYMVMEYLEGIDLAALRRKAGKLPIGDVAAYIAQACDAIAEAHKLGIVHRDLKPSNLFLARRRDDKSVIKVLDFGISKVEHPSEEDTTKTGMTMGSPKYMSPEQMKSMRDTDSRTDIWSLGAILYELLAGRPPFMADSMAQVCSLVLHGEPPPLRELRPDVPPALVAIVARCLEKTPAMRFATADDLARVLAPFVHVRDDMDEIEVDLPPASEEVPISVPQSSGTTPTAQLRDGHDAPSSTGTLATWHAHAGAPRRSKTTIAAAIAVAIALGGGAVLLSRRGGDPVAHQAASTAEGAALPAEAAALRPPTGVEATLPVAPQRAAATTTAAKRATGATSAGGAVAARATPGPGATPARAPAPPATSGPAQKPQVTVDPFGGSRN